MRNDEDLNAVAEAAAIAAVLDRVGYGHVTFPNRQLVEHRNGAAAAIQRTVRAFHSDSHEWPIDPEPRVVTDTSVLISALQTYFGDLAVLSVDTQGNQVEGEAARLDEIMRRQYALTVLGDQIKAAVRPVAALLSEGDVADLEATRDKATGAWANIAELLLHLLDFEREQRLENVHADPAAVPPYKPYGVVDMVPGTFGRHS